MKVIPLHSNVLIRRAQSEGKDAKTASGLLYVPETASEKPQEGEVLAVGPGTFTANGELIPVSVQVGDVVMFERHAGGDIKIDGEMYLLIREQHILCVCQKDVVVS